MIQIKDTNQNQNDLSYTTICVSIENNIHLFRKDYTSDIILFMLFLTNSSVFNIKTVYLQKM